MKSPATNYFTFYHFTIFTRIGLSKQQIQFILSAMIVMDLFDELFQKALISQYSNIALFEYCGIIFLSAFIGGIMNLLIKNRRYIQLFFGIALYVSVFLFHISLWLVLIVASILGIFFGKFFCKWMCPLGFIMELMTKNLPEEQKNSQMYNYYKVGCPISWIQGLLNKVSFFRIINNKATCLSCGKCDKVCYITNLNKESSLYKEDKSDPTTAFNCSKCMVCVSSCPNGSLSYKSVLSRKKTN
jgi:polyferredoxin